MYEEDKIFGPLTFKQFLCLAAGLGLCYIVYNNIETKFAFPLIFILGASALALVFKFRPKKIDVTALEEYLKSKKASLDGISFNRWVQRKIAEISSQIQMRKAKGLREDQELQKVLDIFSTFINNQRSL